MVTAFDLKDLNKTDLLRQEEEVAKLFAFGPKT